MRLVGVACVNAIVSIDHIFTSTSGLLVLVQDIRLLQHLRTASLKKGDQSHCIKIEWRMQKAGGSILLLISIELPQYIK